jgi:hypothetical protein
MQAMSLREEFTASILASSLGCTPPSLDGARAIAFETSVNQQRDFREAMP